MKISKSICTEGLVILDDRTIPKGRETVLVEIARKARKELTVCCSVDLAMFLDNLFAEYLLPVVSNKKTLCVFPGNGGQEVKRFCQFSEQKGSTVVPARRLWFPGSNPVVSVGEVVMPMMICPDIEVVVVIDDVISSGQTIDLVRKRNSWKFPRAEWYAGCWITRGKVISGYKDIFAGCSVINSVNPAKKPPINSLSTLLDDAKIREDYAGRNFGEAKREFIEELEDIRKVVFLQTT